MKKKGKFTSSKQTLVPVDSFHQAVDQCLARNEEAFGQLYGPAEEEKQAWAVDKAVEEELHSVTQALALRVLRRAHLLAMYRTRTNVDTFAKAKVTLSRDDMETAIATINMDAQQ